MLGEGINPATGCRERKNVAGSSERGRGKGGSSKLMEIRIGLRLSAVYLRVRFDVERTGERNRTRHNLLLSAKSRTDGHIINRVIVSHGVPFNIKIPYFDINNSLSLPPPPPPRAVFFQRVIRTRFSTRSYRIA